MFALSLIEGHADVLAALPLDHLFRLALSAGLLGLGEKGRPPLGTAIAMNNPTEAWEKLLSHSQGSPLLPHVRHFHDFARSLQDARHLLWLPDDIAETAFDLAVIQRLLQHYPQLSVTVVPKNGTHDNDASASDVAWFMHCDAFRALRQERGRRFSVSRHGPRMGTINLDKLSPPVTAQLAAADLIFTKGSRIHEMLKGVLARAHYVGYVLSRDFNESQVGADARHNPLVFFRSDSCAHPWWGFRGRATRIVSLAGNRDIRACYSTLMEREQRSWSGDRNWLLVELNRLLSMRNVVPREYGDALEAEIALVRGRVSLL
jgi:hypothetical protein